jgi:hypothetical protein
MKFHSMMDESLDDEDEAANHDDGLQSPKSVQNSAIDKISEVVPPNVASVLSNLMEIDEPLPTPTKSHGSNSPISRPTSSSFTAHDLVHRMQHPSLTPLPFPNGQTSLPPSFPGIFQTPFTPRPGETGSRPGTAHHSNPPSTAPVPPTRGALEFQQQIAQMQHNIQARTSPVLGINPTPSSFYDTPTGLHTFLRNQSESSPWERSLNTPSASSAQTPKKAAQASPFGAIGDRPRGTKNSTADSG